MRWNRLTFYFDYHFINNHEISSHFTRITQFLNLPTFQSCQNPRKSSKRGKNGVSKKVRFRLFPLIIMELFLSDGCIHIISTISLLKIDHFHVISPDIPSILATDSSRKMTCNLDCDCAQKSGCISKKCELFWKNKRKRARYDIDLSIKKTFVTIGALRGSQLTKKGVPIGKSHPVYRGLSPKQ